MRNYEFMRMIRNRMKRVLHSWPFRTSFATRYTLHATRSKGFSLLEFMVAIAIFMIISSILVVSQRSFGGGILITNLAYDVALTVRQAQVYGISVRKVVGVSDSIGQFDRYYGIHMALSDGYYILFADADGDGKYDTAANSPTGCLSSPTSSHLPECVSFFKIEKGNYIKQFCGGPDCAGLSTNDKIDTLEILFHRPEPEPTVRGYKNGARVNEYTSASMLVSSPSGMTKSVCVSAAGQISIKSGC